MLRCTKTKKKAIISYDKMTHQYLIVQIFMWSMINIWPINSKTNKIWIYDVPF